MNVSVRKRESVDLLRLFKWMRFGFTLMLSAWTVTILDMNTYSETRSRSQVTYWKPFHDPSGTFTVESKVYNTAFHVLLASGLAIRPASSNPLYLNPSFANHPKLLQGCHMHWILFHLWVLSVPSLESKLSTPCPPLNKFLLKASTSLTLPWSVFWCCKRLNALQHLQQCMKITSWCFCFVH